MPASPERTLRLLSQIDGGRPLDWLSGHASQAVMELVGDGLLRIGKNHEVKLTRAGLRMLAAHNIAKRKPRKRR